MKIYEASLKGKRQENEDAHNIISKKDLTLIGVYDGHGGDFVSKFLAKYIPYIYCSPKLKPPFNNNMHNSVFNFLQKKILKYKQGYSSGSTCCLGFIYKIKESHFLNVVNIGDSRACIVNNNNETTQITVDHKPDDENEKKRIEKNGGHIYYDTEQVPRVGDLSLSRAIGDGDQLPHIIHKPDIHTVNLHNIKYVVFACDGLWDVILNDELGSLIDNFIKTTKCPAKALAELAIQRGSFDNVSVIIVEL